jgi:hypothetical protein
LTKAADGVDVNYQTQPIALQSGDAALSALIAEQKAEHLTEENNEIIANIPEAVD